MGSGDDLFIAVHEPAVVITEDDVHFAEREAEAVGTEGFDCVRSVVCDVCRAPTV